MYEIIAMDNTGKECVIYNDKANNTDYKVENPKLVMAEDTAGSLNFKIPPTHPHYDALDPMKTLLKVIRDGECIWAGRITELRMDLWDQKEITCEGVLGFLNDTVQEPGLLKDTVAYDPKKILQLIINRHNTQIQKADGGVPNKHKTFTVGVVNVYENPNDALTPDDEDTNWYTDWNTSWNALNQILFERYPKGHLRCQWRKDDGETEESWHIDYISQENYSTSEQTIEFGKNLIDFTRNYTMTDLKTVCLPRGAVLEDQSEYIEGLNRRLGVTTVNNIANGETSNYNDQFIRITQAVPDSTALEDMGWIVQEVVWDEVSDKTKLKKRAKKWLREEQFDNMVIEINAVDLHYLNPSIKSADILTKIRCVSKPHGMDREFPITKIEIVLDKPESSKITLGSSKQRSFTGSTVGKNRDTDKEISDIWKKLDNLQLDVDIPAVDLPSWTSSSWQIIYQAIRDHHAGVIDLFTDYGWRPGDVRSITIKPFESDEYNTIFYGYADRTAYEAEYGDAPVPIIRKTFAQPEITVNFKLLSKGGKKIHYIPSVIKVDGGTSGSYSGTPNYVFDLDEENAKNKECAFVVGIDVAFSGPTRNVITENYVNYLQPSGLPFDDVMQYISGATSYNDLNYSTNQTIASLFVDKPALWPTSWLRKFLKKVFDNIDISWSTTARYGNVTGGSKQIFSPMIYKYTTNSGIAKDIIPNLSGTNTYPSRGGQYHGDVYRETLSSVYDYIGLLSGEDLDRSSSGYFEDLDLPYEYEEDGEIKTAYKRYHWNPNFNDYGKHLDIIYNESTMIPMTGWLSEMRFSGNRKNVEQIYSYVQNGAYGSRTVRISSTYFDMSPFGVTSGFNYPNAYAILCI